MQYVQTETVMPNNYTVELTTSIYSHLPDIAVCWSVFVLVLIACLPVCIIDERDTVQKKTFTKWVNKHLIRVSLCCHSNHLVVAFLRHFSCDYV